MPTTRSSKRKARRISGTPVLSPQKSTLSRARGPKPGSLKQCLHKAACCCGSDIRPTSESDFRLGVMPPQTVTEGFIAANLGLTAEELVHLICIAKSVKDAIVATICAGETLQSSAATRQWRMIDQEGPVLWLTRAAKNLEEAGIFAFPEPHDFDHLQDATDWTAVALRDVDIHRGCVPLRHAVARQWTCTAFVPVVMKILNLGTGPSPALVVKLTNTGNARHFLLYHAIKLGLGVVSSTKLVIWDRAQAVQIRAQVAKLLSAGGHQGDADLEKRIISKVNAGLEMQVVTEAAARLTLEKTLKQRDEDKLVVVEAHRAEMEDDFIKKQRDIDSDVHARLSKIEYDQATERQRVMKIEIQQEADRRRLIKIQTERENDRGRLIHIQQQQENDREQNQTDREQNRTDRQFVDERLATMQAGITLQGAHIHSVLNAVTLQAGELHETRQIFTAQLNNLVSTIQSAPATAPIAQKTLLAPAPRLFLRMRNPPLKLDPESEIFDRFAKIFIMGETTFRVANQVVSALHTPFLVVLMGYSGAGKSYTMLAEDGVIAAIIGTLPSPVNVTVSEISDTTRPMADLQYPKHSISEILDKIESSRTTSQTPANVTSSRAHLMIHFENIAAGIVYGCVVDVCGAEESGHRAEGGGNKARSTAIANENTSFRLMLMELAGDGKSGFTTRGKVSVVKHASPLNLAVGRFLKDVVGEPEIRVVGCMDGEKMDQVVRVLSVLPDFA